MPFDPNQPRDKNGEWAGSSVRGHNAAGGNRSVANHIKNQHKPVKVTAIGQVVHSTNVLENKIDLRRGSLEQTHQVLSGPKGDYKVVTHDPREFLHQNIAKTFGVVGSDKKRTVVRQEQKETLHTVYKDGNYLGAYRSLSSLKRSIKKGTLY